MLSVEVNGGTRWNDLDRRCNWDIDYGIQPMMDGEEII